MHFADGTWIAADKSGLWAFEKGTTEARHWSWHEVQQVLWNRETDRLRLEFADPARDAVMWENPDAAGLKRFGDATRRFLNHSQIYAQFAAVPSGTKVRVTIREREDGTRFSEVVAFGALEPSDEAFLSVLESEVRDAVGLP